MQPPQATNVNLGSQGPLILIGASVRAAAQSAARAGYQVTGIDLFGDTDTLQACESYLPLQSLTAAVMDQLHSDGEAPLFMVGGVDPSWKLAAQWGRCDAATALTEQSICQPETLREIAHLAGVHYPDVLPPGAGNLPAGRWLQKNARGCGGLSVRRVNVAMDVPVSPDGVVGRTSASHDAYLQRWVAGQSFGATFAADGSSAVLLGVCRGRFTRIGDRPFVYSGSLGPVPITPLLCEKLKSIGRQVVQVARLRGLFNVDVLINGNAVWLLEVNPRWSGSSELIERALIHAGSLPADGSLLGSVLQHRACDLPMASSQVQWYKRIVFARCSGAFDPVHLGNLQELDDTIQLADIPHAGRFIGRGEPILTLIIRHERGDSWQRLRDAVKRVILAVRPTASIGSHSPRSSANDSIR